MLGQEYQCEIFDDELRDVTDIGTRSMHFGSLAESVMFVEKKVAELRSKGAEAGLITIFVMHNDGNFADLIEYHIDAGEWHSINDE